MGQLLLACRERDNKLSQDTKEQLAHLEDYDFTIFPVSDPELTAVWNNRGENEAQY